MNRQDMEELSALLLHATPGLKERDMLVTAVQGVDRLDDVTGPARTVLLAMRRRYARQQDVSTLNDAN